MSPKKKKKTETVKSSPLTDTGYRLSIDPKLMGHRVYGRNPLDDLLESEDEMMARDFKTMRVEEASMKRKVKMAKLQKEINKLEKEDGKIDSDDSDMPRISVAMAQQIARLPPEEREKVIETYAIFSSIAKGKGESMLPLLIGFSKSNPGTPQINMLDYAKAMGDQLKTGIDLAKAFTTKEKPSNATEVMKLMKDLVIEGVRTPILQALKDSQPQPGILEQFITNPELFSRVKELGLFGREPRTGSTNIDLEIEKLRGERQLEITKLNLDMKKSILEIEAKDRRTDTLLSVLGPVAAVLAGPVDQRMRQLGQQQASAHMQPGVPQPGKVLQILCSCGYQGVVPDTGAKTINCPKCGLGLRIGEPPDDSGNLEKADSGA